MYPAIDHNKCVFDATTFSCKNKDKCFCQDICHETFRNKSASVSIMFWYIWCGWSILIPLINPKHCTSCGACVEVCPNGAITMEEDK